MEILRKQNEKMTKEVASLTGENHKLTEPLKQAQAEVEEYKKQLQNYKMDKLSLAVRIRTNFKIQYEVVLS